jgi:MFS family permease
MIIALGVLFLVRESGEDRAAAEAHGSVRDAFRSILRDADHRWIYLTSILGGGGRGLGVVNLFALLYLTRVIGLDDATSGLMYGVLIVMSVPAPLVAGWLSDRLGRKPLIIGVYLGGAVGFAIFILAGSSLLGLWAGIAVMGIFSFAESPQLQALLADIADPTIRDASFALYFTLAFGIGSLWTALYGVIIDATGNTVGIPLVFAVMAISFIGAAGAVLPVRAGARRPPSPLPDRDF